MSGRKAIFLMTWNINGFKTKVDKFREVAKTYKVNIAFLQETHIAEHEIENLQQELEEYGWELYSTGYSSCSKGVAILIQKNVFEDFEYLADDSDEDGSYLILRCTIQGQFFTLVSMYQHHKNENIMEKLIPYLQDCCAGELLIGGDFNTVLNSYLDRTSMKSNHAHAVRRRWVQNFMAHLSLVDVWRSSRPLDREYTCSNHLGESRLDYIFMQEEFMSQVKTCEILDTPKDYSDHKPVRLQLTSSQPSQCSLPNPKEIWERYFSKDADFTYGEDRIKHIEITRALRSILKSDLPRPDGIPVDFYKSNIDNMSNKLKVLYNQMLDNTINDAAIQMFFKDTIHLSDNPYHIFSVVYLILAKILARHLEEHLNSRPELTKKGDENKILMVYPTRSCRMLKWSLLKQAITALKDRILPPHIFVKLLGPIPKSDCIELRDGCPLTSPLLLLYWKYLLNKSKKQTRESWPSDSTSETIIHGETVIIRFSFEPDENLKHRMNEKLCTLHYSANTKKTGRLSIPYLLSLPHT